MKDTLRTVPEFVLELGQSRSEGARQMFAALFITTLEDAQAVVAGGHLDEVTPEGLLEWATDMHKEIDRGGFRQDFLTMLASEGFLMNTHPGFGLVMMTIPYVTRDHIAGIAAFETACQEYGKGERESPEIGDFIPDCPKPIERELNLLRIHAHMNRLVLDGSGG
jgi:hypothetical protein